MWHPDEVKVREAIRASLRLLSTRDRRLLRVSVVIQMSTSLLDLAGVLLLGLVGALAVTVVQSQPTPAIVQTVADTVGLGGASGQQLVIIFAGAAAAILLTKSVVSAYLTRRVLVFLANRQALVAARLSKALLEKPLTFLLQRSSQETAYALIQGAGHATIQVLGQTVIALSEISLLVILSVALLIIDPVVTVVAIVFFGLIGIGLQKVMGGWAARVGNQWAKADIASLNAVQESLTAYREVSVTHRREFYVDRIQRMRWDAARATADSVFIGMVPKFAFEAALVVGGVILAGVLFVTQDSVTAVGILALFLAASTRVMPSLLRLQAALLMLRNSSGAAERTIELAEDLGNPLQTLVSVESTETLREQIRRGSSGLDPSIEVRDVSFTYQGSSTPAIHHATLSLAAGESLAFAGTSGAGKSTLADLVLGVLTPDEGEVRIGGISTVEVIETYPGGIAYVPQEVVLANASVRENVALGLPLAAIEDDLVWEALERAHLDGYLREQRDGLDTQIGEGGVKLSGGQRQRLGIARALYSRPKLVVLDEATSALDAETEDAITQTIRDLEGNVTTVIVAHRLSTIRHVDCLVYLEEGRVAGIGTFDEVRSQVPALQRQAALLGL